MSALLVLCTCPDHATAESIARALVERRLAACVSLLPGVESVYRWQGAVEHASEVQLLIKTVRQRYPEVEAAVLALHPYELPELLAVEPVAGLERYLAWMGEESAGPASSEGDVPDADASNAGAPASDAPDPA